MLDIESSVEFHYIETYYKHIIVNKLFTIFFLEKGDFKLYNS